MDLSWLRKKIPEEELIEKTQSMAKLIDSTIQTVRKISTELRPGILDDLGLIAAIEWQAGDFQSRTGIKCEFNSSLETVELDRERSTAVFRICQETLTNVARHSYATRVIINVEESAGNLTLEVDDNGKGISESEISNPKSLGLLGMKERAHIFGGELNIVGTHGKGTTVTVKIPFDSRDLKKQIPEINE
jgi:signal transduction histidine kinase